MTKCDKCGKEVGELYCAKCRAKIEGVEPNLDMGKMIPLLFYDVEHKCYRFGCSCVKCPYNRNGLCVVRHLFLPNKIMHEYDGDNIVSQFCG